MHVLATAVILIFLYRHFPEFVKLTLIGTLALVSAGLLSP